MKILIKKTIFIGISVLAVAVVVAVNVNFASKSNGLSNLTLANVEALADNEASTQKDCWSTITTKKASQVFYCGTCDWIDGTYAWNSGSAKCDPK